MLTDIQKKTFKELEDGKLDTEPKKKADFYYRMSNILKNYLEGLDEAAYLLSMIPGSYLEKIDLPGAVAKSMLLCEAMLKLLDLPTVEANFAKTDIRAVRKFDLGEDNYRIPPQNGKEFAFQPRGCSITCDLTKAEAETVTRTLEHIQAIEAMLVPCRQIISPQEFYTKMQPSIFTEAENKAVKCQFAWDLVEEPNALMRLLQTVDNMKKQQEAKELMIDRPAE